MFKYYLRRAFRDREFMFWSLFFPILLMTCFKLSFMPAAMKDIDFDPVKCAVLTQGEGAYADEFQSVIAELSDEEKVKTGNLGYDHAIVSVVSCTSMEEAEKMILEDQVEVVFLVDATSQRIDVQVGESPSTTSLMVARSISESFRRNYTLVQETMTVAPERMEMVMASLSDSLSVMKAKGTFMGESTNYFYWYFYSTIVMGMFFNVSAGVKVVFDIQGNLSGYGMRTSVSPERKMKILMTAFLSRYVLHSAVTFLQIICMNKIFEIPLANRIPELILFVLIGNLFAMSLGSMFGLYAKGEQSAREGQATGLIMLSVFLSGEMIVVLPGFFEKYCPIINQINPATIMNFAFYRLVFYPTLNTFWMNIIKISIATVVFLTLAILKLRREKYAAL